MAKSISHDRNKIKDMIIKYSTYEEEIIEKGRKLGRKEARKQLFKVAKNLVSTETLSLAETVSLLGLNKTEAKKLAKELEPIDAGSDSTLSSRPHSTRGRPTRSGDRS
jgi:hypothetical protein